MSTKVEAPDVQGVRAQPEGLRARALSLSLTVKDVRRSMAWYGDTVGFHVDRTWERDGQLAGATVVAGDVRMNLNQDDGKKGKERTMGQGFSIHLTTVQDVDALAAGIRERGGKLDSEPADRPWGVRSFYLTDPDGYKVGIQRRLDG